MWTKHVIEKAGFPVKVYVDQKNETAVLFFLFGKYAILRSDVNVLDFAVDFIIGNSDNVISFANYNSGLEDTAIIEIAA